MGMPIKRHKYNNTIIFIDYYNFTIYNILLNNNEIKIDDFGFSKFIDF